jgi:hypothetical protein
MMEDTVIDDHKYSFPELADKNSQTAIEDRKKWFKKGELWPTIILVEKGWDPSGTIKTEHAYIRILKNGAIVDILVGLSLDDGTLLAIDFNIPLFSITCSRKGIRGAAQRIHLDLV